MLYCSTVEIMACFSFRANALMGAGSFRRDLMEGGEAGPNSHRPAKKLREEMLCQRGRGWSLCWMPVGDDLPYGIAVFDDGVRDDPFSEGGITGLQSGDNSLMLSLEGVRVLILVLDG